MLILQVDHHINLEAMIMNFIDDKHWCISPSMNQAFSNLNNLSHKFHIPKYDNDDYLIWTTSKFGTPTFKDAYMIFFLLNRKLYELNIYDINTFLL